MDGCGMFVAWIRWKKRHERCVSGLQYVCPRPLSMHRDIRNKTGLWMHGMDHVSMKYGYAEGYSGCEMITVRLLYRGMEAFHNEVQPTAVDQCIL